MNLGLIGAIGGLGSGASQVGKKYMEDDSQKERDERLFAQQESLEAKRQAFQERLQMNSQEFQGKENAATTFTADQNKEMRDHAAKLQQQGFTHAEALAKAQQAMQLKIAGMHEAGATKRHGETIAATKGAQGELVDTPDGLARVHGSTATPVYEAGSGAPGENGTRVSRLQRTDPTSSLERVKILDKRLETLDPKSVEYGDTKAERDRLEASLNSRGPVTANSGTNRVGGVLGATATSDAPKPAPAKKMEVPPSGKKESGPSDQEVDGMIRDAERGGETGIEYLKNLDIGSLNYRQRLRVTKALEGK